MMYQGNKAKQAYLLRKRLEEQRRAEDEARAQMKRTPAQELGLPWQPEQDAIFAAMTRGQRPQSRPN
jgi:hypothetical protein